MTSFVTRAALAVAFTCNFTFNAVAQAAVTVEEPWARATVPGQKVAAAYMKLRATEDLQLVAVRTSVTPQAEIHEMSMQGGVMKMRQISALALPAQKTVELKPGGYHLMLVNLTQPLTAGERVPLTLVFENRSRQREEISVQAEVRAIATSPAPHKH